MFKRNCEDFVIISLSVSTWYLVVLLVFTFVFHLEVVMVASNTLVFCIFLSPSTFMSEFRHAIGWHVACIDPALLMGLVSRIQY